MNDQAKKNEIIYDIIMLFKNRELMYEHSNNGGRLKISQG